MSHLKLLRAAALALILVGIASIGGPATAAPAHIDLFEGVTTPQSFTIQANKDASGNATLRLSASGPCEIGVNQTGNGAYGQVQDRQYGGPAGLKSETFWVRSTVDANTTNDPCIITLTDLDDNLSEIEAAPTITVWETGPSITIIKNSIGGTATFDFTTTNDLDPDNEFTLNTAGDGTAQMVFSADPGTYAVTEEAEDGFTLTSLTCNDQGAVTIIDATVTIELELGDAIVCTFENTSTTATVTIVKNSIGDNAQFNFTTTNLLAPSNNFNINTNGNPVGTGQDVFDDVEPGEYDVTENVPTGFTLTALICEDPDNGTTVDVNTATATLDVDAGEAITCTFTNTATPTGSITIVKNSIGDDANFTFTVDGDLDPNDEFNLNTTADGTDQIVFDDVTPGTYTFAEQPLEGFSLTALVCEGDDNDVTNVGTATATVDFDEGETIVCTFTNTAASSITIVKSSVGGTAEFDFTTTNDLDPDNAFTLDTGAANPAEITFDVGPGTYGVTELAEAGFSLSGLQCDDPDEETTTDIATATAAIDLDAGEAITCTFTNTATPTGSITIIKNSVGGTGAFDFTTDGDLDPDDAFTLDTSPDGTELITFEDVAVGTYLITELNEPGFTLTNLVCTDTSDNTTTLGNAATINFEEGDTVTCTFTNTAQGSITIVKNAVGGDGVFNFTGDFGAFALETVGGTASTPPANLAAGTYTVTEALHATFTLTSLTCSDGSETSLADRTATIELTPGESIVCTFTNSEVTDRTTEIIENFIENRANTLMEAGPPLTYFLDRFAGRGTGCTGSPLVTPQGLPMTWNGACQIAMNERLSMWLEGTFERYREGGPGTLIEGRVRMFQGGVDYLFGDRLILGITALIDGAFEESDDLGYRVEGLGWMAGPYGAVLIGDSIVFDAKFLWGTSVNDISPFMTYTDVFRTARWMATARIGGEHAFGLVIIRPEAEFIYFRETQREYVDGNGITIPEQIFSSGRLTFGPELALAVPRPNGNTFEPFVKFEGVWDITDRQVSARLEGGFRVTDSEGFSFQLMGTLGGIFVPDYVNWGVRASLTVPLP